MNNSGVALCPRCSTLPEVSIEGQFKVVLTCPRHGHMAVGAGLDKAVEHWNHYIRFISQAVEA